MPNQWLGYAVTLIVMSGLSGYVLVSRQASVLPIRRGWIELPLMVTILLNGSALIAVWTETPPSRKLVVEALHAAIPPGARVLGPARE